MANLAKHRPTKRHSAAKTQQVLFALLSAEPDDVVHLAKEALGLGVTRREIAALLGVSAKGLSEILGGRNA